MVTEPAALRTACVRSAVREVYRAPSKFYAVEGTSKPCHKFATVMSAFYSNKGCFQLIDMQPVRIFISCFAIMRLVRAESPDS
jgi:hypothetical protein